MSLSGKDSRPLGHRCTGAVQAANWPAARQAGPFPSVNHPKEDIMRPGRRASPLPADPAGEEDIMRPGRRASP